jgi:hypothetical protein
MASRPETTSAVAPAQLVSLKTFLQIWPILLVTVVAGLILGAQH